MSVIHGITFARSHKWVRGSTRRPKNGTFYLEPSEKCTDYHCDACGVRFRHMFGFEPDLERALMRSDVPNKCPKSQENDTTPFLSNPDAVSRIDESDWWALDVRVGMKAVHAIDSLLGDPTTIVLEFYGESPLQTFLNILKEIVAGKLTKDGPDCPNTLIQIQKAMFYNQSCRQAQLDLEMFWDMSSTKVSKHNRKPKFVIPFWKHELRFQTQTIGPFAQWAIGKKSSQAVELPGGSSRSSESIPKSYPFDELMDNDGGCDLTKYSLCWRVASRSILWDLAINKERDQPPALDHVQCLFKHAKFTLPRKLLFAVVYAKHHYGYEVTLSELQIVLKHLNLWNPIVQSQDVKDKEVHDAEYMLGFEALVSYLSVQHPTWLKWFVNTFAIQEIYEQSTPSLFARALNPKRWYKEDESTRDDWRREDEKMIDGYMIRPLVFVVSFRIPQTLLRDHLMLLMRHFLNVRNVSKSLKDEYVHLEMMDDALQLICHDMKLDFTWFEDMGFVHDLVSTIERPDFYMHVWESIWLLWIIKFTSPPLAKIQHLQSTLKLDSNSNQNILLLKLRQEIRLQYPTLVRVKQPEEKPIAQSSAIIDFFERIP